MLILCDLPFCMTNGDKGNRLEVEKLAHVLLWEKRLHILRQKRKWSLRFQGKVIRLLGVESLWVEMGRRSSVRFL